MGISLYGLTPATTYDALIKTGDNEPLTASLKVLSDGVGTNLPMEASTTGINFTGALQQSGVAVPTASQVAAKQDTLVSGTNIKTINGTSVLGSGNIVTPTTNPSGVAGAIQFSNGSAFASDAINLFWDDTNNRLGVGTNVPTHSITNIGLSKLQGIALGGVTHSNLNTNEICSFNSMFLFNRDSGGGLLRGVTINSTGTMISADGSVASSSMAQIKGSGSTSATTSFLVQNSAGNNGLRINDDQSVGLYSSSQLCMNSAALPNNNNGLRFLNLGSGSTYIDGWSDGTSKATNYPLVIGSRVQNIGSAITNNTTTENGTPVIFGFEVAQASALVTINSTTRGFLPPRMTTTQKNAIATPATGLVVYDSTTNKLQCYNGSTWNDLF